MVFILKATPPKDFIPFKYYSRMEDFDAQDKNLKHSRAFSLDPTDFIKHLF